MPTEISTIRDDHALEGLRRELSAARQQLATVAEISRSIRGSRNDLQAVFDGIVHSAVRLLRGNASTLSRIVGNGITLAATASTDVACDRVPRPMLSAGTLRSRRCSPTYFDQSVL
jgi:hypothetical protein